MPQLETYSNVRDTQRMYHGDPYYRLALAVILQALDDLKSGDHSIEEKARWWLEKDGMIWWELIGFQPHVLRNWLHRL